MRIALQYETAQLRQSIYAIAPDAELISLPADGALELDTPVDLVLATATGSDQLAKLFKVSPDTAWVHIMGTGVDAYPLDLLAGRLITCSKGATATPIAEWVLAMILAQAKRLPDSWVQQPPAHWYSAELDALEGKTLGIIGFGEIGQAIAKRALAFEMNVLASVRQFRPSPMAGVELVESIDALIPRADHLVLALPATAASRDLINAKRLAMMKHGSHLINISRAALLDHSALREVLDSGQIARASLDVVEPEPLPSGHWLYQHPKVNLSPHISWNAPLSYQRMLDPFLTNLRCWIADKPLHGVVDTVAGY